MLILLVLALFRAADADWAYRELVTESCGGSARVRYECSACSRQLLLPMYDEVACRKLYVSSATTPAAATMPEPVPAAGDHVTTAPAPAPVVPPLAAVGVGLAAAVPAAAQKSVPVVGNQVGRQAFVSHFIHASDMSYKAYADTARTAGREAYSKVTTRRIVEEIRLHSVDMVTGRLDVARADVKSGAYGARVCMSADGTYMSLTNSQHSSEATLCKNNGCLVSLLHASADLKGKSIGNTVGFPGSAHSSENYLTGVSFSDLKAADVPINFAAVDGDAGCAKTIKAIYTELQLVPCFNHWTKNKIKRLMADFHLKGLPSGQSKLARSGAGGLDD